MAPKTIAPYGTWKSELSAADVTAGSRSLRSPRVCPLSGRAFFLESRANGSKGIVEATASGVKHVLPETHSASTIVYEYGGLPYAIIPGDALRIIFSDSKERTVKILQVDSGEVGRLTQPSDTLRYADFDAHPRAADRSESHAWVLAIQEDHDSPVPSDAKHYIVGINTATGEIRRVVQGADFYSYPRFSPDGGKISWLEWNHPGLPFLGVNLFWADWTDDGAITNVHAVAGQDGLGVAEPRWSPDGTLFFAHEKSNFRQLFAKTGTGTDLKSWALGGLEEAEFGDASWPVGCQSYIFLSAETIVAAPVIFGEYQVVHINLTTGAWKRLDVPSGNLRGDCLAALSATSFLLVGSGISSPESAFRVDVGRDLTASVTLIRQSVDKTRPESLYSKPERISFTGEKGFKRQVYGFYWPPHNPEFAAPDGELPPLIIKPHGGPTGHTTAGLALDPVQYYTSRGYAFFAINYTGSSAHGKEFRESLFGRWGIADTDDAAEAAAYFISTGRADPKRIAIEGISAGGYNVLQSLCWYPDVFASGISFCGVGDVKALTIGTHKMESRYMDVLLDLVGKSPGEKDKVYKERSPLYHAHQIRAPLLLVHGEADPVVPIQQSRDVQQKIEERGGDVKLIAVPGEGHGFAKAANLELYLRESEAWWQRTLLKNQK